MPLRHAPADAQVPTKIPGSQDAGPILFNAYGFAGSGLVNCVPILVLWALGHPFEFQAPGLFAALDIVVVQYFARQAVWRIGIGAGPACWASVAILTSFLWGTGVFGDRPWHLPMAFAGLVVLIVGVVLVSYAVLLSKRGEPRPADGAPDAADSRPPAPDSRLLFGFAMAVVTGLCDGSLVTFFMHFQRQSDEGRSFVGMMQYLGSLGLGALGLDAAVLALFFLVGPGRRLSYADLRLEQCFVPGALSGASWALANSGGILAAHYMGMALAFPLTQTCLLLNGVWSLLVFRDFKTRTSAAVFCVALLLAFGGAVLLSLFGRATNPFRPV